MLSPCRSNIVFSIPMFTSFINNLEQYRDNIDEYLFENTLLIELSENIADLNECLRLIHEGANVVSSINKDIIEGLTRKSMHIIEDITFELGLLI